MVVPVCSDSSRIMVFCAFRIVVQKDLFSIAASPDAVSLATKVFGQCGFRNAHGFAPVLSHLGVSGVVLAVAFGVVS